MDLWPSRTKVVWAITRQGFHGFSSLSGALAAPLDHSDGKGVPQRCDRMWDSSQLVREPWTYTGTLQSKIPDSSMGVHAGHWPWLSSVQGSAGGCVCVCVCDRSWCGTGKLLDKSSCAVQCLKPVSRPCYCHRCITWPLNVMKHKYFIFRLLFFRILLFWRVTIV